MAIFSLHFAAVKRSNGENAVSAAAYISRSKLIYTINDPEIGQGGKIIWDYSDRNGLVYSKIIAPLDAPEWVYDREELWNKAEVADHRKDSRPAHRIMIALPKELTQEQHEALAEGFAKGFLVSMGMVVDLNIHYDSINNPHLHIQTTTRVIKEDGSFGLKNRDWGGPKFIQYLREGTCDIINHYLELNGHDSRVSHLSFKARGIGLIPGVHMGPAQHMVGSELRLKNEEIRRQNAKLIIENPELVLQKLSINKPVFTKEEISAALFQVMLDQVDNIDTSSPMQDEEFSSAFMLAYSKILSSDKLTLIIEKDLNDRTLYALTKRVELEKLYEEKIETLNSRHSHSLNINEQELEEILSSKTMTEQIKGKVFEMLGVEDNEIRLTNEQKNVLLEVLNGADISVIEGMPGSGKTFIMKMLAKAYRKFGYNILGAAQSSSAALNLESETGIKSKNNSLWRKEWQSAKGYEFKLSLSADYYKEEQYKNSKSSLGRKSIFIVDEASMLELASSDYLAGEILKSGAKMIRIGDNNQYPAVGMAGAFKKDVEICGSSKLSEIWRQKKASHKQATALLGAYRISEAIELYRAEGVFKINDSAEESLEALRRSYVTSYIKKSQALARDDMSNVRSIVILAHTNNVVDKLNQEVRARLMQAGIVKGVEKRVKTGSNYLYLARGEQIVFESNDNRLGIFNGEVGTVLNIHLLDSSQNALLKILVNKADGTKRTIMINTKESKYLNIDYGYALTGYKIQGGKCDKIIFSYEALCGYEASYVMMTRHREDLEIFASSKELENIVYQRLGPNIDDVKKDFLISSSDELWVLGLLTSMSRRANLSFTSDYINMGLSANDKLLKKYIESNKDFICLTREIDRWQQNQLRLFNKKPEIWGHESWAIAREYKKSRDEVAKIISNDYESFKDRIIELQLNYETIRRQAKYSQYKYTAKTKDRWLRSEHYSKLIEIAKDISSTAASKELYKSFAYHFKKLNEELAEVKFTISLLHEELDNAQKEKITLHREVKDRLEYVEILFPQYISRIYKEAPEKIIQKWNNLSQTRPINERALAVNNNPQMLGALKGIGLGKLFALSTHRQDAISNLELIGARLTEYETTKHMACELNQQIEKGNYDIVIEEINQKLTDLSLILPNKYEEEFLNGIAGIQKNGHLNRNNLQEFLAGDLAQKIIHEYYSYQQDSIEEPHYINESSGSSINRKLEDYQNPDIALAGLAEKNAVFTQEEIYHTLFAFMEHNFEAKGKDKEEERDILLNEFNIAYAQILSSNMLTKVAEQDLKGRGLYALTSRIDLEKRYVDKINILQNSSIHSLNITEKEFEKILSSFEISKEIGDKQISASQKTVLLSILNGKDISVIEGMPGSGKTFIMKLLKLIYEREEFGYKVLGSAPSSGAALNLESETGIRAQNNVLWRKEWQLARGYKFILNLSTEYWKEAEYNKEDAMLDSKSIFIVDEASMLDLASADYLASEIIKSRCKVIFIGDNNQYASIKHAGAFKKNIDICGAARLDEIWRQRQESHKKASLLLGYYEVAAALEIYKTEGLFNIFPSSNEAIEVMQKEYIEAYLTKAKLLERDNITNLKSLCMVAHSNKIVDRLNQGVREKLLQAGVLKGEEFNIKLGKTELLIAKGEQILFKSNDKNLGILNGEIGTVLRISTGAAPQEMRLEVLVNKSNGDRKIIQINSEENKYTNIGYGYAVTGYKLQGGTCDDVMVFYEPIIGYEAFNVMATRHKDGLKIYASKTELEDIVYKRLGADIDAIREEYSFESQEALWFHGMILSASKRSDLSFAVDYFNIGVSESDKTLKEYIDTSKNSRNLVKEISNWQVKQEAVSGERPEFSDHELADRAFVLLEQRKTLSTRICNNYSSYRARVSQLQMNYETIKRHAKASNYSYKITAKGPFTSSPAIKSLLNIDLNSDKGFEEFSAKYALIKRNIETNQEIISSKKNIIRQKIDEEFERNKSLRSQEIYKEKLFFEYISRIYQDSPTIILQNWEKFLEENSSDSWAKIESKPDILGKIKLQNKDDLDANLSVIRKRFADYEIAKTIVNKRSKAPIHDHLQLLDSLKQEVLDLRKYLPNKDEREFLKEIQDLKNSEEWNKENLSLLIENKKSTLLINKKSTLIVPIAQANLAVRQDREKANIKLLAPKNLSISFEEIRSRLCKSDYENLFHLYAPAINPDGGRVQKKGNKISCGSLMMDVNSGLWYRFSTGDKGNIFHFIQEATGCNKLDAKNTLASHLGLSHGHENRSIYSYIEAEKSSIKKEDDDSFTYKIVPDDAPEFNPEKDLYYMLKQYRIEEVYKYKNLENKLIGYTVRFIDRVTGKKDVRPAVYVKKDKKNKWALGGLLDKFDKKPIYGVEKLKGNIKPVLIVEGEKTANKASELFPKYNVVSWLGGVNSASKVDWSILEKREVIIWPDNDTVGIEAANSIASVLNRKVNSGLGYVTVIDPAELLVPEKWDLADSFLEGKNLADAKNLISMSQEKSKNIDHIYDFGGDDSKELIYWKNKSIGRINSEKELEKAILNENIWSEKLNSSEMKIYTDILKPHGKESKHEFLSLKDNLYKDILSSIGKKHGDINYSPGALLDRLENIYVSSHKKIQYVLQDDLKYNEYCERLGDKKDIFGVIAKDIILLQQEQLGEELPQFHISALLEETYKNLKAYIVNPKEINGDVKVKIADKLYQTVKSKDWWEGIAKNRVKIYNIEQQNKLESFENFLYEKKIILEEMKELSPNYDFEKLKNELSELDDKARQKHLDSNRISVFKTFIAPQIAEINKGKMASKSLEDSLKMMEREKELCIKTYDKYRSVAAALNEVEKTPIVGISTKYHMNPKLMEGIFRDAHNIEKFGIWDQDRIADYIKETSCHGDIASKFFSLCRSHIKDEVNKDITNLCNGNMVENNGKKFKNVKFYLEYQAQNHEAHYVKEAIESKLEEIRQHELRQAKQQMKQNNNDALHINMKM